MATVAALTEFELIDRFFRRPSRYAVLGVGDDAALIAPTPGTELAISVDMLVENHHFFADVEPATLGHKALAVNLSDLAAMGATPRWVLLAGALPRADATWVAAFAQGFLSLADAFDVELIGGDTTRGPLNLCVTAIGEAPAGAALRRSGAGVDDAIWVSGVLGDAALAVAHRLGRAQLDAAELRACERALQLPSPRIALGVRLRGIATAAIDVSDGLTGDLGHILTASQLGAEIALDAVPRSAAMDRQLSDEHRVVALESLLAGGDDYELCFTAPARSDAQIRMLAVELQLKLTRIGVITAGRGLVVRKPDGTTLSPLPRAFDHFAQ